MLRCAVSLFICATLFIALTAHTYGYPIEELKKEAERLKIIYELALQEKAEQSVWKSLGNEVHESAEHDGAHGHIDFEEQSDGVEVASIMGVDVGKKNKGGPRYCLNNGSTSTPTMTQEDLQQVINTVEIVFGTRSTLKTFVTVEYGSSMYSEFEPLIALILLYSNYEGPSNSKTLPDKLWMSKSPCPACAKRIISDYHKEEVKPTVYVASLFTGNNFIESLESLKCLVKLMYLNYTVLPWDWNEFREHLHNEDCRNAIGIALENEGFVEKQRELLTVLEFAQELTRLPENIIEDWCPVALLD